MAIVIYNDTNRDLKPWIKALKSCKKDLDLRVYPDIGDVEDIIFAITWVFPKGLWSKFPNLKAISSIGAGVSHILDDTTLSKEISILKLTDKNLNQSMWEYTLGIVMFYTMNLDIYSKQQKRNLWQELSPPSFKNTTIGIMGLGSIGQTIAINFEQLGFNVKGYSFSAKDISNIETFTINDFIDLFLKDIDILISVLPLTNKTTNIFNKSFFSKMKKGSKFINVGRGAQVVEDDLIESLNSGQLNSAFLDVFKHEPLEKTHQFWKHPDIHITPHIASITSPNSVAPQIIDNYERVSKGLKLLNKVNLDRGY